MKKLIVVGLLVNLLTSGCGSSEEKDLNTQTDKNAQSAQTGNASKKIIVDGPYQEKYANGQLKIEGTMSGGKKEGEWKSYYENGSSYSVTNYAGGLTNGKTTTWFPNGQIRYIGYYTDGKPSGTWLIFNDKGEKVQEKEY